MVVALIFVSLQAIYDITHISLREHIQVLSYLFKDHSFKNFIPELLIKMNKKRKKIKGENTTKRNPTNKTKIKKEKDTIKEKNKDKVMTKQKMKVLIRLNTKR